MSAILPLVRRWAVDWLSSHDPSVLGALVTDDYELRIGGLQLEGRSTYRDAVLGQLRQFPGLVLTVHDVIGTGDRAAVRFTEHGASKVHDGRIAAWGGIALFRATDGRLAATFAEEDYTARRRQLRSGTPDAVEAPHPAPWDIQEAPRSPEAEAVVADWIAAGMPAVEGVLLDDQVHGQQVAPLTLGGPPLVDELFSAGSRVAFHVTPVDGGETTGAAVAGIVDVEDGKVTSGRLVRDRLGAERRPARV